MLRITRRLTRRGLGAGARTWRGLVWRWTPAPDPAEVRPRLSPASWSRHPPATATLTFPPPLQCRHLQQLQHSAARAGETETQTRGHAGTLQHCRHANLKLTGQWTSAHLVLGQQGHGERVPGSWHYPSHKSHGAELLRIFYKMVDEMFS